MIDDNQQRIGRIAWVMAWVGLVVGQLHALARFRTDDGRSDLDLAGTRWWAEPAGDFLSPLLTWAGADTVYHTYGKLWLPVFLAFTAGGFLAHRRRAPQGKEKWAWRVALTGYVGACVSVGLEYWTQWGGGSPALLDAVFLASLPFVVLTMLSSTVLGITLLVKRSRPTSAAVLLALAFPGALLITQVTSMGNIVLPIVFAFGILGRQLARETTAPAGMVRATAPR
ncbi:MAG: hypothetical protein M3237_12300 [Actinomycetota bacterium]|nr:hypothetical protein [Actinomycetota bacterium]